MASLMASFPLKEKEKLERPPLILAPCSVSCREGEGGGGRGREGGKEEGREGEGGEETKADSVTVKHIQYTHSLSTCKVATADLYNSCCFDEGNPILIVLLDACCDG